MNQFDNTAKAFAYRSNAELKRAHFLFFILDKPVIASFLISMTKLAIFLHLPLVMPFIKKTFFAHFCGGETLEKCEQTIQNMFDYNVKTVLDYSVEGKKTEHAFDNTTTEILRTFDVSKKNKAYAFCVFKITGIADALLLEKIQNKKHLTSDEVKAFDRIQKRVNKICSKAYEYQQPVLIDAENSWFQDTIDEIAYDMMKKYNTKKAIVFNTFQMYRNDVLIRLKQAYQEARKHTYVLGVKIVRGAYMEKERRRSIKMNYPDLIWSDKKSTNDTFHVGLNFCIANIQYIALVCGSHNNYSNHYLTTLMKQHEINYDDTRIWFIQLYGMGDNISFNLAEEGYNVAKYVPYGPAHSVIPYLIRRAQENTSVVGQSNQELILICKEQKRRRHSKTP